MRKQAASRRGAACCAAGLLSLIAACADSVVTPPAPSLPQADWYLVALGADPITAVGLGRGQSIAVLDTGVDTEALPSFRGRVGEAFDEITHRSDAVDDNGHGTEVAVVAAGGGDMAVWGLAPGATLIPIKVADRNGRADPRAVAAGIRQSVQLHASVINLSLATEVKDPYVAASIGDAISQGVVVVAAAGDADESGPLFPASEPGVVAVYAQDPSGSVVARFNQPTGPSAMAPGVEIGTLTISEAGVRQMRVSGTSFAAAIVSGLLADCLSVQVGARKSRAVAVTTCEARVVRQPVVRGFLDFKSVLEV